MNAQNLQNDPRVAELIRRALEEDIGAGDATTIALVPRSLRGEAVILARKECTVAGVGVADAVMRAVDPEIESEIILPDGARAAAGAEIIKFRGASASILTAERTALNFMQRMTGIATLTRRFVDATAEFGTMILDTRKTTPTLRVLEKYSVLCGGGTNHRFGLFDRVLIKDNHRKLHNSLERAVNLAREKFPELMVEVEVENFDELADALRAKPEWIMFDNMSPEMMRRGIEIIGGIAKTEASGGITLERAREVAATGVDAISLGCLTHSAPSVDLSLEWAE